MSKVLYVRGFNENLHDELSEVSRKEGVSPASVIEEALEEWLQKKDEAPKNHYVLLYSDEDSLINFLKNMQELTKSDWLQAYCGPESHTGTKFLKKHKWFDITISPYSQALKNPEKYAGRMFDRLAKESNYKQVFFVGFMTEYFAHKKSLKHASEIEKLYNGKRCKGIAFCPYSTKELLNENIVDILDLFEDHDKVFVLKKNELYELKVDKQNFSKVLL